MAKLSKTAAAKPRNITKTDIQQYLDLEAQRREHNRQAYLLGKKIAGCEAELSAFVLAKATGKVRSIERSGFRLSIVEKNGSVSWKTEFVNVAGQEAADELVAAAPKKEELQVEQL